MLDDEFIQYCKLNNIEDIEKFAKQVFDKGFTITKYGDKPQITVKESGLEVIEKWKDSGVLDNLKPMSDDNPIVEVLKPKTQQNIETITVPKKEKDLYGE